MKKRGFLVLFLSGVILFLLFMLLTDCRIGYKREPAVKTISVTDNFEVVLALSRGKGRTKIAYIRDKSTDIIYVDNSYDSMKIWVPDLIDLDNVVYGKDKTPMTYSELKEIYNLE